MGTHRVCLVLVMIVTSGCAFGTRRAAVQPPPVASLHGSAPVSSAAWGKIVVIAFADQRSNKRAIGEVSNRGGCIPLMSSPKGEVSFIAHVDKDGRQIRNTRYTGKGSTGLNWTATGSGYVTSLESALKESLASLIADRQVALR